MKDESIRRRAGRLLGWLGVAVASTAVMWPLRDALKEAHVVLVYLLVVLTGSAWAGRSVGFTLAVASFLLFDFFLLPPYYTLSIADPLDWWVLVSFLTTGAVAAQLLHRAQQAAELAGRRALEIERLAKEASKIEALRETDRLKDALLASVSHDLRTPLTSIRAAAADIRADGHEAAAIIEEEAERLNRFVTDLLDLSRIRAGALPIDLEIHAADDLIGAALMEVRGLRGADRLAVVLPDGAAALVGRFDFVHALRALVNLLENALRYTPAAEPIRLKLVVEDSVLGFEVHDGGPGISTEAQERMFEPFVRGPQPKGGSQGTGLGLAIARSLAEAQKGEVRFRPAPDGGSIFALQLPRAEPPAQS